MPGCTIAALTKVVVQIFPGEGKSIHQTGELIAGMEETSQLCTRRTIAAHRPQRGNRRWNVSRPCSWIYTKLEQATKHVQPGRTTLRGRCRLVEYRGDCQPCVYTVYFPDSLAGRPFIMTAMLQLRSRIARLHS